MPRSKRPQAVRDAMAAAGGDLANRLTWRDWGVDTVVQEVVKALEAHGIELRHSDGSACG